MSLLKTFKATLFRNSLVRRSVFAYRSRYGWQSNVLERQDLAAAYLSGQGLEIGALQFPLPVPKKARVTYVDRMTVEDLRTQYPELRDHPLVQVALVDDGETLSTVLDASQDFVIACQFLEHCANPIRAIENFLRVTRDGGILYLAIPNKDFTFDRTRRTTSLTHLWNDYQGHPEWTTEKHFQEFARGMSAAYAPGKSESEILEDVARLLAQDYSIHYHVWNMESWIEFILSLHKCFHFRIECILRHSEEIITIVAKINNVNPAGR